jgi:hypothetical protein
MSTLTDKLPKLTTLTDVIDLDEAKKPAFAAVGVVDLYVEQLKELPADVKKAALEARTNLTTMVEELRTERPAQVSAQVKALPATVKTLPAQVKELRTELTARVEKAQTDVTAQVKALPETVKTLPTTATAQVKELRTELTARVEKAQTEANEYYGKLAVRGEKLVTQIRRQPTTEAAIAEGKAAAKKASSAAASAKKATKAAEKAVVDAAEKIG